MTRQIPVFSIQFTLPEDAGSPTGSDNIIDEEDLPNYNELAIATTTHLDLYFSTLFGESPASYHASTARLHLTGDPLTVDLHVSATFDVPGQVPTLPFMFDRIRTAFEDPHIDSYYAVLHSMSHTNPFQKTAAVTLINHIPNNVAGGHPNKPGSPDTEESSNNNVVIPFLAGLGCLALIIVGFVGFRKNQTSKELFDDDSAMLLEEGDGSVQTKARSADKAFSDSTYSHPFGADDATIRYLESIRERYQEEELEDVSLGGDSDEEDRPAGDSDESTVLMGGATASTSDYFVDRESKPEKGIAEDDSNIEQIGIETVLSDDSLETETPEMGVAEDDLTAGQIEIKTVLSDGSLETETPVPESNDEDTTSDGRNLSEETSPGEPSTEFSDFEKNDEQKGDPQRSEGQETPQSAPASDAVDGIESSESEKNKDATGKFEYLDLNSSFDEDLRSLG
jgi:hypothetical protein